MNKNNTIEYVKKLKESGIRISVKNNDLDIMAPKGKVTQEIIQELTDRKLEILNYLGGVHYEKSNSIKPIENLMENYAVSSAQRRLWVLSQFEGGSEAYNIPSSLVLENSIDVECFKRAIDSTLERHEILRTVFKEDETGEIRQWILLKKDLDFEIKYEDFRKEQNKQDKVQCYIREDSYKAFDLKKGPLLRASLLQVEDEGYVFYFNMHHIISDGWSMEVLSKDVFSYYEAYKENKEPELKELRIQYKDYSAWQLGQIEEESFKSHRAYWLNSLEGELPLLDLPSTKQRPRIKTNNGNGLSTYIDRATTGKLKKYSEANGGSLFMGLLATWNILMYRYTSQNDIIIGTPIAGREHADLEDQIGFYLNTLALRNEIKPEENFNAFYGALKDNTLKSYSHQMYPFDRLVEELELQRDTSRSAVFDVILVLQNNGEKTEGLELKKEELNQIVDLGYSASKFDLDVSVQEIGDYLSLHVIYNSDVYEREMVEGLLHHYRQLLNALLESPGEKISQIGYLSEVEKHELLITFNDTVVDYPQDKTIIELFEEQVTKTPDNVAVVFEGKELTYRQLNEQSNQLGHYLQKNYAIKPDDLVGIKQDRSEWMIISILGVLKSGGAYVPIDPGHPQDRIDYIKKDIKCKVCIDENEIINFKESQETYSGEQLLCSANPSSLAYVIYTSGSTGQPKGVLVEHRNVVRLLKTDNPLFDFGSRDVWTMFHSYAFDFSVWEMYGALLFGGKLVLVPKTIAQDTSLYLELIQREGVTVINQTPSAFYNLSKEEKKTRGQLQVRYVIFGGEALSPGKLQDWRDRYQSCQLINMYGITETTVHTTYKEIGQEDITLNRSNIGKAIPTVSCIVLDQNKNLVPSGITGELYIGGEGVARGYLNRESLTNERFIANPFAEGERLYRTGDKVKQLINGDFEYLGRIDDQVKIRGYRIELGEIEHALLKNEQIKEAVVLVKENQDNERELVAYITAKEQQNMSDLRSYLKGILPEYMLPTYYVQLEALPLTSNGKIDKKSLPNPERLGLTSGVEYVAPRTEQEKILASVWAEVLKREGIGVKDSFYNLGGDSIKVLRMIVGLRKKMNYQLSVADIYNNDTIEEIIAYVSKNKEKIEIYGKEREEESIRGEMESLKERIMSSQGILDKENIEDIYPMSDIEKGMVFGYLMNEGTGTYHDQMIFHRVFVEFNIERFKQSLGLLTEKHSILRTGFNLSDYECEVQIVYRKIETNLHYADVSDLTKKDQEDAIKTYLRSELKRGIVITNAPLWRMSVFMFGEDNYIFIFQCHHAIIDGWSNASFLTELNNLYLKLGENINYKPARLKASYKDFIVQHEMSKQDDTISDFWKKELSEYERLDLFTNQEELGRYSYLYDNDYFKRVENVAKTLNTTVKVVSLSAYLYMLKVLNYNSEIVTGLVTNIRPTVEDGDKILGCFLNTIPLRVQVDGNISCSDFIMNVHKKLIELKNKERLSMLAISSICKEKSEHSNPFFDVLFNYVDFYVYQDVVEDESKEVSNSPGSNINVAEHIRTNTFFDFTITTTGGGYGLILTTTKKLKSNLSVEHVGALYFKILDFILKYPDKLLKDIDYLTQAEKHELLVIFNDTRVAYPQDKTIVDLFEEQVTKTSDNVAVVFGEKELTYRELNELSNQLAHYLQTNYSIQPDDLVGIKLNRSEWMIVSILGVLKSGGAYVSIDPQYPQERIDYIEKDIACKVCIDEKELRRFKECKEDHSIEQATAHLKSNNLIYVIYTSGSTGKPKGVLVEHSGVVNRLLWMRHDLKLNEHDVFLQKTPTSFDVSVWELLLPLIMGSKLVIAIPEGHKDPVYMEQIINDFKISIIHFVPSMLSGMMENITWSKFYNLRHVVCSGEALPLKIEKSFQEKSPIAQLHNYYGPTEASVDVTAINLTQFPSTGEEVLIGKPMDNTSIYILNEMNALQPVGILGEILIGGVQVARGYLNQEELTKEKFIASPFRKGERLYKTGDLGRWTKDGSIEYIGRKDNQVKIRGYRIELGEIEHALLKNAKIKEAVVVIKENENKEKALVVYFTASAEQNVIELRYYLKELLPEYMIPAYFVQLGSMPLTSNGKVDKRSLPDPQGLGLASGIEYVAPRNEREKKLVRIWEKVLQRENIGVKDDFFALGGHSLKAVQLSNDYGKEFSVKISLKELFVHTCIELQASLIASLQGTEQEKKYDRISLADKKEYYALSSGQKRLYFLQKLSPGSVSYNMPQYYFFNESLDPIKLDQSLCKLIDRHEILRTYFADEQGIIVQRISQEVSFSTDYHECTDLSEVNTLVQSAIKAFDLSQAPLLRSVLIKMKDQYVWMIDIHHIISDGTSGQILLSDMVSIYQGLELPALTISYKDYAEWQNKLSENGELVKQQNYWKEKLSGELPVLNFPADFPRPAAFTFQGSYYTFRIDETRAAELKRMGDRCRGTLQMSLMAILKILVFKYTGQEDLIIGCGISGRSHNELEDMVGMFVNMLAIRSEASDAKTFSSFYKEEISASLEAYDNQDVQFDDLVDTLKITRDISRNPIFDIALVVQNFNRAKIKQESDIVVATSGYNLLDLNFKNTTSKFDLTFFVNESAEEIEISIEYYTGIFKESTVKRIADHFNAIVDQVVANDKILISDIDMLSESERGKLLSEFNATTVKYPKENSIHSLFSKQSILTPDKIAVSDEEGSYTYLEIEKSANRLGNFLKQGLNIPIESYVGILQSRNKEIIPSILGVLKSGGGYLNLDAEFPEERLLYMLKDARVKYLLTEKNLVGLANRLQWRTEIEHIICIDSQDIYAEHGGLTNDLMRKDLWDFVGDRAVDAITAGGWLSSYTGHAISAAEMQEYSDNAYLKLKKLLHKEMKVLEIGCSSGLTMFQVAPQVSRYYGTDLSSSILEYAQGVAIKNGHENVYLKCMPAHEIDLLGEKDFDLIIINSVIQCFEDHNYLRDILKKSIGLLKGEGVIFAGDLMDEDERLNLIEDLKAFKRSSTDPEFKTKMDWSSELFVSRAYFNDLLTENMGIADVDFSGKIYTIENELTKFRYDALLRIDKKTQNKRREKNKYQHDLSRISQYKDTDPGVEVKADNLAYVMYTSGSTGQPKGVMIEHRSVVRLVKNTNFMEMSWGDKILGLSNFVFDGSTFDIFMPLLNGGELVICSKDIFLDIHKLDKIIGDQEIGGFFLTTALFNSLVDAELKSLSKLKYLLFGGEQVSVKHVKEFKKLYPAVNLHHVYGPTENTTFSTWYAIKSVEAEVLTIPIGSGISNSTAYILDHNCKMVPIGVIGEICVGGVGLARGYLNQEEVTREKFIKNSFKAEERLYKTGDLGRWLPDGNIEFIGRKDNQVKIRGHRIELGEIEHALLKNEQIQEAVVLAKPNQDNEKEIVAYITSKSEQKTSELRSYLKDLLPEYMLPIYFFQLEVMPLNANGKIDKKSLPDPQGGVGLKSGVEYLAPRNETEARLIKIWQGVLQRENIGVKDDFFELGGHSLKAVRLSNEYQKELAVKISLKELFHYISVESHAKLIENSKQSEFIQIEPVGFQESYPVSSAQRRLWVLSQFEGGSVAYNSPSSVVLENSIDIDSFKRAIESTVERHEILRTVFKEDESGEIRQWIINREDLGFKIDYRDYRKENNTDGKVREYIAEDSYKAFDLEKGPLLRAGLLQVEDERYVFYLNMHHIISDGWSMEVLSKDVMSYYDAYKENKEPALKPLRIQYKDYSAWQLGQLKEESYKDHRAYWLKSLEGELPLLNLPSAKQQRPRIKTSNGRTLRTYLNKEVSDMLKKYSQEKGGSLFMGLLASWNVILYRYTGQQDMIIGSPVAGREHADLEDQIGFYVNTLALRNEIDPEESFDSLFLRVKQKTLTAYSHQMYPFDKLVEELNLVRDTSRSAVFDVMLVLQNNGERVEGVELKEEELNQITDHGYCTSRFDMEISVQEIGDYLVLQVGYNPDVYEKEMVEGLMKHYNQLLKALLKDPGEALSQIDYLSESEKHQLLVTFNDTGVDYPKDKTIVELFGDQAEKTPHNIAVVFEENKLTYGQLDEKSNQLAHYLQKNYDIKPDDLVGIKLDRSEWMIVSVLGVLKAGGAYVPIDPEYPQERIDYIEKDTRCKVCIGEKELENFRKNQKKYSTEKVTSNVRSGNLAYVIYTSGSTGKPKGVMIEHGNLVNYLRWYTENFKVVPADSTMAYANFGFDASVGETLTYLIKGASVHIAPQELLLDVHGINGYYESNNITIAFLPTPVCQQFMHLKNKSLRCLTTGGDRLIQFVKNDYQLINNYGPTETTVVSTTYKVNESNKNYPIGQPVYNTEIYILSESLNLLPIGVVGEIFIGGDQVARGYLNKEKLTAEKFIENPFKESERMYKTGDLGRWLPDGNIEFIGRTDDQVKVRGYRIELGEIEHALQIHKEIEEVVVNVKEGQNNEKELVAYITSKTEQNTSELRSYLKGLLPEYMVPAYFVQLEVMPLTSNGKVDKRSLPDPEGLGLTSGAEYVAPRNETEKKLVKIWEKILQRENIGIKDGFFALGGNSIKTIQASREYTLIFDKKVPLTYFISNSTISEHAEYITLSANKSMAHQRDLVELNTFSKTNKNMIMIPPVQGEAIYFLTFAKFIENRYNCYSINYGMDPSFKSLTELSKYYAELIDKHSLNQTLCIIGFSMGVPIAFEIVKILESLNYNCELFLIDRFPNSKAFVKEIEKADSDNINEAWFNSQVSIASRISPKENVSVLRKRLMNNCEILNKYMTSGKINSNISCLESSTSRLFNMKSWKKFTCGKFEIEKIEALHDEIFNKENYKKLYEFISKNNSFLK